MRTRARMVFSGGPGTVHFCQKGLSSVSGCVSCILIGLNFVVRFSVTKSHASSCTCEMAPFLRVSVHHRHRRRCALHTTLRCFATVHLPERRREGQDRFRCIYAIVINRQCGSDKHCRGVRSGRVDQFERGYEYCARV